MSWFQKKFRGRSLALALLKTKAKAKLRVTDGQSIRVSKKGLAGNQPKTIAEPLTDGKVVVANGARQNI